METFLKQDGAGINHFFTDSQTNFVSYSPHCGTSVALLEQAQVKVEKILMENLRLIENIKVK
jgi:hypothetical protein